MSCKTECFLASGFIGSSIAMMISSGSSEKYKKMYSLLNDEQRKAFINIKKERLLIYGKASAIAFLVSLIFAKFESLFFNITSSYNKACISTLIYFGLQYLIYSLHPKSDWMLNHIKNNEQAKAWLEIYTYMKNKWHMGLVFGLIGYYLLSIVVFKKNLLVLA